MIAPSLVPVRAGDRVKTDRRDAKKLVTLFRAGLLRFVQPPTPETEGLRDPSRCRDDIRCARTAARHLLGRLSWIESVNPQRGQQLRRQFTSIAWRDDA